MRREGEACAEEGCGEEGRGEARRGDLAVMSWLAGERGKEEGRTSSLRENERRSARGSRPIPKEAKVKRKTHPLSEMTQRNLKLLRPLESPTNNDASPSHEDSNHGVQTLNVSSNAKVSSPLLPLNRRHHNIQNTRLTLTV